MHKGTLPSFCDITCLSIFTSETLISRFLGRIKVNIKHPLSHVAWRLFPSKVCQKFLTFSIHKWKLVFLRVQIGGLASEDLELHPAPNRPVH